MCQTKIVPYKVSPDLSVCFRRAQSRFDCFFVLGSGFEGVTFAELELNTTQDAALLTLLTEQGDLLSTILTEEYFVVSNDQCGIQFFGSLNDHFFTEAGSTNGTTFDNTRTAVDDFQDNNSQD